MRNKGGYVSIYVCIFFVSLVTVTGLLASSAKAGASQSAVQSLGRLWGQSILAEYDLNLQKRYHLFGYYGTSAGVKDKLDFYLDDSLSCLPNGDLKVESCTLYDDSLRNTTVFEKQIVEIGKLVAAGTLEPSDVDISPTAHHEKGDTGSLFADLPSEGTKGGFSIASLGDTLKAGGGLKDIVKKGTDRWFQRAYFFSHFKHLHNQDSMGESYFQQEVEYLICGKISDEENEEAIKNRIIALREVMNLAYLNDNEAARTAALAAAELLTPGPAAVATQQTLLGLWAYAESVNDYKLLMEGYPVPLRKTEMSWAVDLDAVLDETEEDYIYTGCEDGASYEEYLKLLMTAVDGNLLLLRSMDLIQINMRCFYYDGFLLEDYYSGVSFGIDTGEEVLDFEIAY